MPTITTEQYHAILKDIQCYPVQQVDSMSCVWMDTRNGPTTSDTAQTEPAADPGDLVMKRTERNSFGDDTRGELGLIVDDGPTE